MLMKNAFPSPQELTTSKNLSGWQGIKRKESRTGYHGFAPAVLSLLDEIMLPLWKKKQRMKESPTTTCLPPCVRTTVFCKCPPLSCMGSQESFTHTHTTRLLNYPQGEPEWSIQVEPSCVPSQNSLKSTRVHFGFIVDTPLSWQPYPLSKSVTSDFDLRPRVQNEWMKGRERRTGVDAYRLTVI